ncbi:SDR family NAD(P)-dependent oxidoreductase [Streptomyces spiralis]|uniref:SDR family NAD(P)-dependent oxidoreductase n=1 Tax=Streptomyces spiralis TaxID=66376 RepID=UPI0036A3E148
MTAGLVGRTALITGSGHGIGAAIATTLAQAGVDVILRARTAGQLDDTANAVSATASSVEVSHRDYLSEQRQPAHHGHRRPAVQPPGRCSDQQRGRCRAPRRPHQDQSGTTTAGL